MSTGPRSLRRALGAATAATLVAALAGMASAQELPVLRRGLWEFERTVRVPGQATPQKLTKKQCTSPADDMKKQNETLAKAGCRFSPTQRAGNAYTFTAECPVPGGGKATSRSVVTVAGDGAYTVRVESEGLPGAPAGKTTEDLSARRLGDCAG